MSSSAVLKGLLLSCALVSCARLIDLPTDYVVVGEEEGDASFEAGKGDAAEAGDRGILDATAPTDTHRLGDALDGATEGS